MKHRLKPLVFALASCALSPLPAISQGWEAAAQGAGAAAAGYVAEGGFRPLLLDCGAGPGVLRIVLAGPGWRLQPDFWHTVVLSVDDIAFVLAAEAAPDPANGAMRLVHEGSFAALSPLLAVLKAGDRAEVSTPLGRYEVPLKGSGRALAGLERLCAASGQPSIP